MCFLICTLYVHMCMHIYTVRRTCQGRVVAEPLEKQQSQVIPMNQTVIHIHMSYVPEKSHRGTPKPCLTQQNQVLSRKRFCAACLSPQRPSSSCTPQSGEIIVPCYFFLRYIWCMFTEKLHVELFVRVSRHGGVMPYAIQWW
jgi:hypothetical protein